MAGNPRIVTEDAVFTWDGVSQRLAKGQLIDVPADSALEAAIGADKLIPLNGPAAPAVIPDEPATDDTQASPRKTRATAKAAGDGSDSGDP